MMNQDQTCQDIIAYKKLNQILPGNPTLAAAIVPIRVSTAINSRLRMSRLPENNGSPISVWHLY